MGSIPGWGRYMCVCVCLCVCMRLPWWLRDQEDPLEKGMSTHSSILAWRNPWTEEPAGLQSMSSQRVRHNWATNIFTFHMCTHTRIHNMLPKVLTSLSAIVGVSHPGGGYLQESKKITTIQESAPHAANTVFNTWGSTFIPVTLHGQEGFALSPFWPLEGETPGEFHGRNKIAVSLVHYLL